MIRTTITVDESLLSSAKELTGRRKNSEIINIALKDMVAKESLAKIAALGGTMKNLELVPRRKVL
jgi:Arc/MetJ family transcription regulator